ncbi:TetR/AcrR family transcriptional regulator [Geodermatophilus sp. SYSU D00691]
MPEESLLSRAAEVLSAAPAASMDEIAAAAGVSRATLFRRYPNRQVLVSAVARAAAEAYVAATDVARLEEGPPEDALRRLLAALAPLGVRFGLLTSQPLDGLVEKELLALVRDSDDQLRALVRRGQEDGVFRVDLSAEWVVIMVTWLLVGAADGVRLGLLAAREVERLVTETVLSALRRPNAQR